MPDSDKEKRDNEAAALLALFQSLIQSIKHDNECWSSLEDLVRARADYAIRHAFEGFGISYGDALELIKKADNLTDEEQVQRDILIAAVDNLVDFSTAEEYQLMGDSLEYQDDIISLDEDSEEYEDIMDELYELCNKYNKQYAYVENMDIEYAMIIAAYLSSLKDDTELTYMTMGDERVRPWHLQYEGFSAPRSRFPSWLIPPIEHQCRCYLVEDVRSSLLVNTKAQKIPKMPEWFDKTFKESVANGGRIFSDEHPYFQIDKKDIVQLGKLSDRIKALYF